MQHELEKSYDVMHNAIREILERSPRMKKYRVPLAEPPFNYDDFTNAVDTILSGSLSMGQKVGLFESRFARYIGAENSGVMVNSGSSANLIALSVLTNSRVKGRIKPGEEIITPAVTWATTVFPISMVGAIPVLVDISRDTYNIDVNQIKKAITRKTRAIMPVHLLGNPCKIDEIRELADKHDLFVIEDCCEAHGAEIDGKKVGTFGDMATFSFFISHHISTIEGGMVLSRKEEHFEIAKALRAFGWIRDLKNKDSISRKYPHIDPRFLFMSEGYNLRPTEIQGALGITQLPRLESIIDQRRETAAYWTNRLSRYSKFLYLPEEEKGARHVYFCYPITVIKNSSFTRDSLTAFLEAKGIETRPVMTGNIVRQPSMKSIRHRKVGRLLNAEYVTDNSFLIGNHTGVNQEAREYVADMIDEFMKKHR